ncbi:sigma 54-interacting transcriptional regulator, partial [bacterium]|nr:sigma 54-interacting transcriptional regulator [bacterium]
AQRLLEQALQLDIAAGNRAGAAQGRWHLAGCLRKRGRFEEAQSVLDAARTGYEELHDAGGLALVGILDAHLARARGEDPAVHLDRAAGHARGAGDLRATHHVVLEQGFLAIANDDCDRAITAFRSVLAAVETAGTPLRNDARRGLATALSRRGDREEARAIAEEARTEAARARDLLAECNADLLLAEIEQSLPRAKTVLERLLGTDVLATVAEAHRLVAALSEGGEREYHAREAARVEAGLGFAPPVESPASRVPMAVSPEMKEALAEASRLAGFEGTVVVEGEASVGKCGVAAVIHGASGRGAQSLVTVECRGVPEDTLVRRVFGDATAPGAFEEAGAGTVLLCDIDCAPSGFVIRLGHAVRFKELRRPDGTAVGHAARVLCTSSTPLHSHVRSGRLDPAAYTDIAQATLSVPPLRRRPEDLKALAVHYAGTKLSARVLKALARYDWPGNIEELKNTIEAAKYKAGGQPLGLEHLPDHLQGAAPTRESLPDRIAALERQEIVSALHRTGGNKRAAAEILGVSRKGLIDRLKRLGLWEEYRRG